MTQPERPVDAPPGSPTPEEISARLEALLKRTHALRAQRGPVTASGPHSINWPPVDGELDRYDVVDVPENERLKAPTQVALPAGPAPGAPDRGADAPVPAAPADFTRPDWSELRLRTPADEQSPRATRLWLVTALLALVTIGQSAYIWHLHTTRPAQEGGVVRVDGPQGADVRVDGRRIGTAPIEQLLQPGEYDIEVVTGGTVRRTDRVSVGLGRTVVLLGSGTDTPGVAAAGEPDAPAGSRPERIGGTTAPQPPGPAPSPLPAVPGGAAGGVTVSDTLGAVLIESTPSGLPVTMGGRPRGVTPVTIGQLRPGRHDVLVGGLARQVDITAGRVAALRVNR